MINGLIHPQMSWELSSAVESMAREGDFLLSMSPFQLWKVLVKYEIWHFLNFRFLKVSLLCGFTPSPCDWSLSAQPISSQKAQPRKKSPQAFAHLMHFSKNVCIIRHCYFDSRINKPSTCSFWVICISLDILPVQRSIAFFYLNYPQINGVGKSDHMFSMQILNRQVYVPGGKPLVVIVATLKLKRLASSM